MSSHKLTAGSALPDIIVNGLDGGKMSLGARGADDAWKMVVVYRGAHCPKCTIYLKKLQGLIDQFTGIGVEVVAVSGDPEEKARAHTEECGVTFPVGYGLSVEQMQQLGLYISNPRSPQETDRPFPEPGLFVINGDGNLHIADISNAPFARPDLDVLAGGLKFIRENDYPIRGTYSYA